MQNKLKPCPFCGGEAKSSERDGYSGGEYIIEIECTACHILVEKLRGDDKTIDAWNTRQPAFDWKPIEELTIETQKNNLQVLLFSDGYSYIGNITNTLHLYGFIVDGVKYSLGDIKKEYTYYSLLPPPQTNQS